MIHGNGEILASICELDSESNELRMSGFDFVNMAGYGLKDEKYTSNLLLHYRHKVIVMMKKMGYMPDISLGKEGWGIVEFPNFKT